MTAIKINTESVLGTASVIDSSNERINNAYGNVEKAIGAALSSWEGKAADRVSELRPGWVNDNNAISAIMKNYSNLLKTTVVPNYTSAENNSKTLSSMFK